MFLDRFRLDGRRAFVTGGGTGIGFTTALAFAEAGADVIIAGPDFDILAQAEMSLKEKGHSVSTVTLSHPGHHQFRSLSGHGRFEQQGAWPLRHLGRQRRNLSAGHPAEDLPDEAWRKIFDVNVHGTFWTCRAFGRYMLETQTRIDRHHRLYIRLYFEQAATSGALQ